MMRGQKSPAREAFEAHMRDYKQLQSEGFDITKTRQYYNNLEKEQAHVESYMKTPYFYRGSAVEAYAITDVSDPRRPSHMIEYYQNGHNLEDISEQLGGTRNVQLQNAYGENLDMNQVHDNVSRFASAASEFPHAFTYAEYVEARTPINKRLHLDPPDEESYNTYLQHVERQLASKDIHFVGEVTKPSDMFSLYASMPTAQAGWEMGIGEGEDEVVANPKDCEVDFPW